ncbi:aspartyl/glutamyl-tRNA(Asn/Gln) amidotransferase subunit C [Kaistia soli DSM 19436]|uniref:Aspartyl/glutamyl-tRNA(Asn/Gln) amidotransferase subunit C n=1 Tax=Kaistia soli DSM 19436 TaxID=1122133 RepID=A0A1M5NIH4_9HYPH|nr:Asp-tRNA(Asn)/Glu-tRNA(Gln) amidotransferase subunit GatC [Kaistia soli]SHG89384.1 aspartyl/glutamyl-tRNA(Asn/Gln) amidotransferase subunit C [Kaistia soli DSM 19436]
MSVDIATVKRVARLARIAISDEETVAFQSEINAILGFAEQLNEVDVSAVEPLTSVVAQVMKMRDDVVTDGFYADKVVANAPASDDDFFMVPKVIE